MPRMLLGHMTDRPSTYVAQNSSPSQIRHKHSELSPSPSGHVLSSGCSSQWEGIIILCKAVHKFVLNLLSLKPTIAPIESILSESSSVWGLLSERRASQWANCDVLWGRCVDRICCSKTRTARQISDTYRACAADSSVYSTDSSRAVQGLLNDHCHETLVSSGQGSSRRSSSRMLCCATSAAAPPGRIPRPQQ